MTDFGRGKFIKVHTSCRWGKKNYTPAIFPVNGVQRLYDKDHNAVCNSRRLVHSHDIEQVWECHILHRRLCLVWHAVLKWQLPCHIEGQTMPIVQNDDHVCTSILKVRGV